MRPWVGIARSQPDPLVDALIHSVAATLGDLGRSVRIVDDPAVEDDLDRLLTIGFPAAYRRFLEHPHRALRIAWFGEPLPDLAISQAGVKPRRAAQIRGKLLPRVLSMARSTARRIPASLAEGILGPVREAAAIEHERWSNLRDAEWCSALVDRLVTTSHDRARTLVSRGIPASVIPFGYHPLLAGPMTSASSEGRDLGIACLGAGFRSRRRRRGLIATQVARRIDPEPGLTVLDGIWGADRDALLRRARVLIDIHRVPGNFTGLRLIIALAAGLAVVSEPFRDPAPFIPGVHYVEAPTARLADVALELLADEPRRRQIVGAGQALLSDDVSMLRSVQAVLAA